MRNSQEWSRKTSRPKTKDRPLPAPTNPIDLENLYREAYLNGFDRKKNMEKWVQKANEPTRKACNLTLQSLLDDGPKDKDTWVNKDTENENLIRQKFQEWGFNESNKLWRDLIKEKLS